MSGEIVYEPPSHRCEGAPELQRAGVVWQCGECDATWVRHDGLFPGWRRETRSERYRREFYQRFNRLRGMR